VQSTVTSAAKDPTDVPSPNPPEDQISMGRVAVAASNSLSVSEQRILELRHQYLDESYSVDAQELSAKIVDDHLQP
jgi:Anti-sigma-28 factor, FlgM